MDHSPNGATDVTPQQKSALLLLFITFFIDILGVGLVLPLGPYYVQKYPYFLGHRVEPGLAVGLLTACYPILQLICSPFWGRLSDRIGRRPVILVSLLGNAIAWLLFGFAHSLAMLFMARSLSGILSSASLPSVQAYIADSTPPHKRSVWIGIVVGMGFSFGFILGPAVGGVLGTINLSWPAFLAAGIAFLNFLMAFVRLPESLSPELRAEAQQHHSGLSQVLAPLADPRIAVLMLILWLSTFAMQSLEQNLTLYGNKDVNTTASVAGWTDITPTFLSERAAFEVQYSPNNLPPPQLIAGLRHPQTGSPTGDGTAFSGPTLEATTAVAGNDVVIHRHLIERDTGYVLTAVALVVGFVQGGGLKRLVPRLGEIRLVGMGGVIAAVGFFLVPQAHTFLGLVLVACIVALGFSFISPCLRGLVSSDTTAHQQGSAGGLTESIRSLGMATGPLVGGWLFDRGHSLPFEVGGVCMFLAGVAVVMLRGQADSRQAVAAGGPPAAGGAPATASGRRKRGRS